MTSCVYRSLRPGIHTIFIVLLCCSVKQTHARSGRKIYNGFDWIGLPQLSFSFHFISCICLTSIGLRIGRVLQPKGPLEARTAYCHDRNCRWRMLFLWVLVWNPGTVRETHGGHGDNSAKRMREEWSLTNVNFRRNHLEYLGGCRGYVATSMFVQHYSSLPVIHSLWLQKRHTKSPTSGRGGIVSHVRGATRLRYLVVSRLLLTWL